MDQKKQKKAQQKPDKQSEKRGSPRAIEQDDIPEETQHDRKQEAMKTSES